MFYFRHPSFATLCPLDIFLLHRRLETCAVACHCLTSYHVCDAHCLTFSHEHLEPAFLRPEGANERSNSLESTIGLKRRQAVFRLAGNIRSRPSSRKDPTGSPFSSFWKVLLLTEARLPFLFLSFSLHFAPSFCHSQNLRLTSVPHRP